MKKIICLIFVMICIIAGSDVSAGMQYPEKPCNIVGIVKNIEYKKYKAMQRVGKPGDTMGNPEGYLMTIDIKESSSGCRIADNGINKFYYGGDLSIKKGNKIKGIIYRADHHDGIYITWKSSIINTLLIIFGSVVFIVGVYSYIKKPKNISDKIDNEVHDI